jgi:hypothetical protein
MPSVKMEDVVFHVQAQGLFQFRSRVQGFSIPFRETSGDMHPCGDLGGGCTMDHLRWPLRSYLRPGVRLSHLS